MTSSHPHDRRTSFVPGAIWPDDQGIHINAHGGGMLWHEGRYYWFGEHKIAGEAGNKAHVGVQCYSSQDLYHWRNEGVALGVSDDPDSDIVRACVLERPKVIRNGRTGQFVMWFHLELKGQGYAAARSGVAVSDCVTGPYRFVRSFRPNAGYWPRNVPVEGRRELSVEESESIRALQLNGGFAKGYPADLIYRRDFAGGQMARDMTVFVDDDGAAYHFYSSEENGVLPISRLSDDYLGCSGEYVRAFAGRFHEAPAVFKQDGKYYLITSDCTGWAPNAARLSVAEAPLGPWSELGNPCQGDVDRVATTFDSQSTFVLSVAGRPGTFIFMADRWNPGNAIDGRYIWLPVRFDGVSGRPFIEWQDEWQLETSA